MRGLFNGYFWEGRERIPNYVMSGKLATEAADHELDVVWIIRLCKHSSLVEIKGPNGKILQNVIYEPSMCVPIPAIPSLLQSISHKKYPTGPMWVDWSRDGMAGIGTHMDGS